MSRKNTLILVINGPQTGTNGTINPLGEIPGFHTKKIFISVESSRESIKFAFANPHLKIDRLNGQSLPIAIIYI